MSGDELTTNEPTVRYWRTVKSGNVKPIPVNAPKLTAALMDRGLHVEVHVLTESELAAHTTAARADAWDEGHISGRVDAYHDAYPGKPNPYRSTESEDHRG